MKHLPFFVIPLWALILSVTPVSAHADGYSEYFWAGTTAGWSVSPFGNTPAPSINNENQKLVSRFHDEPYAGCCGINGAHIRSPIASDVPSPMIKSFNYTLFSTDDQGVFLRDHVNTLGPGGELDYFWIGRILDTGSESQNADYITLPSNLTGMQQELTFIDQENYLGDYGLIENGLDAVVMTSPAYSPVTFPHPRYSQVVSVDTIDYDHMHGGSMIPHLKAIGVNGDIRMIIAGDVCTGQRLWVDISKMEGGIKVHKTPLTNSVNGNRSYRTAAGCTSMRRGDLDVNWGLWSAYGPGDYIIDVKSVGQGGTPTTHHTTKTFVIQ